MLAYVKNNMKKHHFRSLELFDHLLDPTWHVPIILELNEKTSWLRLTIVHEKKYIETYLETHHNRRLESGTTWDAGNL